MPMSGRSYKHWPTSVSRLDEGSNLTANRDHDLMYRRFPSDFAPDYVT